MSLPNDRKLTLLRDDRFNRTGTGSSMDRMLLFTVSWNLPLHNPLCLKFKTLEKLCLTDLSALEKYSTPALLHSVATSHTATGHCKCGQSAWKTKFFILFNVKWPHVACSYSIGPSSSKWPRINVFLPHDSSSNICDRSLRACLPSSFFSIQLIRLGFSNHRSHGLLCSLTLFLTHSSRLPLSWGPQMVSRIYELHWIHM